MLLRLVSTPGQVFHSVLRHFLQEAPTLELRSLPSGLPWDELWDRLESGLGLPGPLSQKPCDHVPRFIPDVPRAAVYNGL